MKYEIESLEFKYNKNPSTVMNKYSEIGWVSYRFNYKHSTKNETGRFLFKVYDKYHIIKNNKIQEVLNLNAYKTFLNDEVNSVEVYFENDLILEIPI